MVKRLKSLNFYLLLLLDALMVLGAHSLAYLTRFEFDIPNIYFEKMTSLLLPLVIVKLLCFMWFGLYRGMWRYTSLTDLKNIAKGVTASTALILGYLVLSENFYGHSRSVFLLDWFYTMAFVSGIRIGIRWFYGMGFVDLPALLRGTPQKDKPTRCVLLGAGDAGEKLLRDIAGKESGLEVVAIFDDDKNKHGRLIHGIPVIGPIKSLGKWTQADEQGATEALIAIASISGSAMREIVDTCEQAGLSYRRIPSLSEIAQGRVSVKNLRDVDYRDLLGRETVDLDTNEISGYLEGKTVMVTGAGGSIGSELCRQIIKFRPARLLLVDASEYNLYQIQMELEHEKGFNDYEALLGTLQDTEWVRYILQTHHPDAIFHAAAYKHVPMLESNPWQAVYNNILSTRNLVEQAVEQGVERLLVVSTDKAVRPTNVMGASKRVTEKIMQTHCGRGTRLMAVRFGNVIGSAGSVIPLFRRQIENGGPVTITHPDVIRYFMTIEEAAQLILQAGCMGSDGEIFLLKMGQPVKIADMATDLIRLSGREPGRDIELKVIGLRPGEKLYEELITDDEGVVPTHHHKIMVLQGATCELNGLDASIRQLKQAADARDGEAIRRILVSAVPEYAPENGG